MKEIVKAGIFRFLFLGFSFLVGLFIAVLAGSAAFGMLSLMMVNAALLYLLTGLGTDQAIVWHGASERLQLNKLFTVSLLMTFVQFLLFLLLAVLFFQFTGFTILSRANSQAVFRWELVYFAGLILLEKYIALLYARHRAHTGNLILAMITFLALLILFVQLVYRLWVPVDPFRFFCLLTFLQGLAMMLFFHFSETISVASISRQDIRSFFRFSGIVFFTNLIQFLAYRADYWFIDYFQGTAQVGIYAQANRFAGLLWIFPSILAALCAPAISSPRRQFSEVELSALTRVFNYLNILIAAMVILLAFICYTFFLRQDYFEGFVPLLYMLPGFYFFSNTILLAAFFSARNLLWINMLGSAICLVVIIVADWVLIPRIGIRGAAIANSLAYSIASFFTIACFIKTTHQRAAQLFLLKKNDWKQIVNLQS
jgi:O-antigen/teichoic acid export membrane protein